MTTEGQMVVRLDRLPHKPWGISIGYGAIGLSWLYLNLPTLQWFGQVFQDISQFNGWMLGAGGLLLLFQVFRHWHRFQDGFQTAPQTGFRFAPVLLMVGSGIAAIGIRWLVDFEQLPALLFLLGTYGLVGLFLAEPLWRKGLPVAGLVALVVPFGVQFSLGLGFPARILTAHTVESILANLNIAALSSEDIIVLDTGIAQVDLPCSGLKSLWTGTLLLLGATWIEGRQIGLRWLLVCLTNLALLVLVNMVRVLVLVVVAAVLN
ncbi:exosortase O, partial [filamentous cyanobacterium CCP1]